MHESFTLKCFIRFLAQLIKPLADFVEKGRDVLNTVNGRLGTLGRTFIFTLLQVHSARTPFGMLPIFWST